MISTTSQAMLNHPQQLGLFGDEDQDQMSTQMGFYSFPPNNTLTLPPLASSSSSSSCHHSLKTFTTNNLHEALLVSSSSPPIPKHQHQDLIVSSDMGGPQLQRSIPNLWTWELNMNERLGCSVNKRSGDQQHVDGDNNNNNKVGVSAMKMKKMKGRRKVREPRFCFKTRSDVDVLDDGYKWRKYGQKVVKNTLHPRSYYRCTQGSCRVKKRVERLAEDPRMVITTYEGRHAHSPSHDHEGSQSPSHLTNFFW